MGPGELIPPPPPGFTLIDEPSAAVPPPPPGFTLIDEPATQPAAAPAEEPSWFARAMDTVGDPVLSALGMAAQGAGKGLTNIAGLPVDLLTNQYGVALPPIVEDPVGGSDWLWDRFGDVRDAATSFVENPAREALGFEPAPLGDAVPRNMGERIMERVGEEAAFAAAPMGAALQASRAGVNAARQLAATGPNVVSRLFGGMAEQAAVNPNRFVRREMAGALAAGAGAGAGRELMSDGDPDTLTGSEATGDLLGALGGVGALGFASYAGRGAADVWRYFMKPDAMTNEMARADAASELAWRLGAPETRPGILDSTQQADALRAAIDDPDFVDNVVPGFRATTADATGNANVRALEKGEFDEGPAAGALSVRREQNNAAVTRAFDAAAPDGVPGQFSGDLRAGRDRLVADAAGATAAAQQRFDDAARNLDTAMSGEARGQTIRGALDGALAAAKDVEDAAWQLRGTAEPAILAARFDQITRSFEPPELRRINAHMADVQDLDEFLTGAPDQTVDLKRITALRSNFSTAIREARSTGDTDKARILGNYVDAIDQYLGSVPEVGETLAAARDVSRQLNDRFTRPGSPVAASLGRREGRPAVPDSRVAPRFVNPDEGQASYVDELLDAIETPLPGPAPAAGGVGRIEGPTAARAENPDVRAALRDQILAGAQRFMGRPDQMDAYLGRFDTVLSRFPGLRDELAGVATARRDLDATAQAGKAVEADLTTPGRSETASYLRFGDERAADAMAGVLRSPKGAAAAIDDLISVAGDSPTAISGARSALWDVVRGRAQNADGDWAFSSLHRTLNDPDTAAVADRLWRDNPEHLANLRKIAESMRNVDVSAPAPTPGPVRAGGEGVAPSAETVGSRVFAMQRGVVGPEFTALNMGSVASRKAMRLSRKRDFETLLHRALLDPQLAETLLRENNPANVAAFNRSSRAWFGNRAEAISALIAPENEDDDLMDALARGDR